MVVRITGLWMGDALPCPFCGSQPIQRTNYNERDGDGHRCFITECVNPVCGVNPKSVACGPHGYQREDGDCESNDEAVKVMVERWNRRAVIVDYP